MDLEDFFPRYIQLNSVCGSSQRSPWFNGAKGSPLVVIIMAAAEEDEDSLYVLFSFFMTRTMICIALDNFIPAYRKTGRHLADIFPFELGIKSGQVA